MTATPAIAPIRSAAHSAMEMISAAVKRRAIYQVRFLFLPKPRSSIALEMTSMRSMLDRISGIRIDDAAFSRLTSETFLLISMPRACCDWAISWYSR